VELDGYGVRIAQRVTLSVVQRHLVQNLVIVSPPPVFEFQRIRFSSVRLPWRTYKYITVNNMLCKWRVIGLYNSNKLSSYTSNTVTRNISRAFARARLCRMPVTMTTSHRTKFWVEVGLFQNHTRKSDFIHRVIVHAEVNIIIGEWRGCRVWNVVCPI